MKKKIVLVTMLAALMAVPVFAATTEQTPVQNDWMNQMSQKHQHMMQQGVDNGTITTEEAAQMNEHMQQMAPIMQKMMKNGGMMQNGGMMNGMMQNGGTMGNCNNDNNNNNAK